MPDQSFITDQAIVSMLFQRNESALEHIERKYGRLFRSIALRLLGSEQDAEECVSDSMLRIWNAVPPDRPSDLRAYGAKIVRNRSVDALRSRNAEKRGNGSVVLELTDSVPEDGQASPEGITEDAALSDIIDRFLRGCDAAARTVFILRYWHGFGEDEIALRTGLRRGGVHTSLARTRKRLKDYLKKEGVTL
ncbi:MAG: RNA polymerase sigma factor [Clostridia bacterium]|nr:RNA polymerase sigma factor [Clostridia bacterium]